MVISVFKPNFCDLIKTNTITLKEEGVSPAKLSEF